MGLILRARRFGTALVLLSLVFPQPTLADRLRYIDEAGNLIWVDSINEIPAPFRNQVLRPTPIPDEATRRWLEQRRRQKEQEKIRKEQEEERKRREEERRKEQLRRERERELKKVQKAK